MKRQFIYPRYHRDKSTVIVQIVRRLDLFNPIREVRFSKLRFANQDEEDKGSCCANKT